MLLSNVTLINIILKKNSFHWSTCQSSEGGSKFFQSMISTNDWLALAASYLA